MMKVALDIHLLRPPKLSSQNEMMGFVEYSFGSRRTQSRVLAFRISLRRMILISSLLSAPVLLLEMIPEKTDEHLFRNFLVLLSSALTRRINEPHILDTFGLVHKVDRFHAELIRRSEHLVMSYNMLKDLVDRKI